jgi:hypothetical protein
MIMRTLNLSADPPTLDGQPIPYPHAWEISSRGIRVNGARLFGVRAVHGGRTIETADPDPDGRCCDLHGRWGADCGCTVPAPASAAPSPLAVRLAELATRWEQAAADMPDTAGPAASAARAHLRACARDLRKELEGGGHA